MDDRIYNDQYGRMSDRSVLYVLIERVTNIQEDVTELKSRPRPNAQECADHDLRLKNIENKGIETKTRDRLIWIGVGFVISIISIVVGWFAR